MTNYQHAFLVSQVLKGLHRWNALPGPESVAEEQCTYVKTKSTNQQTGYYNDPFTTPIIGILFFPTESNGPSYLTYYDTHKDMVLANIINLIMEDFTVLLIIIIELVLLYLFSILYFYE